ncbi:uncharacterized protein LOC114281711 [Camellia sinensis]|uniref:uncharacterized protein LOC114281711 n=1 Tax=Camellia sinensis TaxID=4442 RepID=UPI001035D016|nr:uncharacterized protein LOC114281711 [Camellia sinensis]
MGCQKAVAKDLLANIPSTVDAQPAPSQPKPKKMIKKAQPKVIQYAHSFSMQSFETREVTGLQKTNKNLQSKIKTLADQAEAAVKAKDVAEEKAKAADTIKKVLEAQRKEDEGKTAEAQKELQDAFATNDAELKAANQKGYNEGVADVTVDYEKQGEEVLKDVPLEKASWNVPLADKSLDQTLQKIDAELAAEKAAEMSSQQSSEFQTYPPQDAEES